MKEIHHDARFLIRTVSDANDLVAFYNLASTLAFPSLYEGFGLPVIESFACGCPVVCSQEGSLKEITGGAAVIIDPYDVNSIADGIGEVYFNESVQIQHSLAGLKQVKQFSWRKTAQLTAAVYQSVFNPIS